MIMIPDGTVCGVVGKCYQIKGKQLYRYKTRRQMNIKELAVKNNPSFNFRVLKAQQCSG